MKNVYLAGAVRTPIGKFGGTLSGWTAADLGVAVATESLRRANVAPDQITDSIWGCARQAGGGPNVARQNDPDFEPKQGELWRVVLSVG